MLLCNKKNYINSLNSNNLSQSSYELYLRLAMNLSIWIVAHYLILHYNVINEQLQKAKFQIADLEK